jgi:superfamily II DNA or RNA helicase
MPRSKTSRPSAAKQKPARKTKAKTQTVSRLSRTRRPDQMAVADWQIGLRQQFGREQTFKVENLGAEPIFSEFRVYNPDSGGRYLVTVRGLGLGANFCTCPDFSSNDLGTCKHIEFTLGYLARKRGGKTAFAEGLQPAYSEVYLHYVGPRSIRLRLGTDCPPRLRTQASKTFDPGTSTGELAITTQRYADLDEFLANAGKARHEVRCHATASAYIAEVRDAVERKLLIDKTYPQGERSKELSKLLKVKLYPYQAQGALFAVRAGRALIGDEMGLGKTVQAIAAAELFMRHFAAERILVVCPTSLKHQWQKELQRFADREAQVIQGLQSQRHAQYREPSIYKITNYEAVARDLEPINTWSPDVVIVDEAQRIKNWNTIAARALKRVVSPYAVVLTGTPLENRLEELISIVQFVDAHRLGPTWRLLDEHQLRDESGRVIGYRDLDRIGQTLSPIMVRRKKREVLTQLPERIENTYFVPMTAAQRDHHDANGEVVRRIVSRWRKTGYLSEADQRRMTCALQNMRMSCNSTYLLDHETDHGVKVDELLTVLTELFEQQAAKVVIFSQWVRTHELIIKRLQAQGWEHVLFHGGIPGDKRGALVERFHKDPDCRVFLSTDAGGVGLNLQHAAATIVNMDLPWNPAVLEQRIGRVHRLGQSQSVQVVNFVAQGTIEEGMLGVLAFKKSLFAGILDGGDNEVLLNGTRLSQFMQSVDAVTSKIPEMPVAVDAENVDASTITVLADEAANPVPEPERAPVSQAPTEAAAWAGLIKVGLQLAETLMATPTAEGKKGTPANPFLETDPKTGQTYLKLPAPKPEALNRLASALTEFIAGLQR